MDNFLQSWFFKAFGLSAGLVLAGVALAFFAPSIENAYGDHWATLGAGILIGAGAVQVLMQAFRYDKGFESYESTWKKLPCIVTVCIGPARLPYVSSVDVCCPQCGSYMRRDYDHTSEILACEHCLHSAEGSEGASVAASDYFSGRLARNEPMGDRIRRVRGKGSSN